MPQKKNSSSGIMNESTCSEVMSFPVSLHAQDDQRSVVKPENQIQVTTHSVPLQDPTPVCTPTFLERRKSTAADDDEYDDEIIINMPKVEQDEDCFECEDSDEDESSEEDTGTQ